jgi:hypothetical protein
MIASILIIVFSFVLFLYWFRYTCLLILGARSLKDYAGQVAAANQLSFLKVQDSIAVANEVASLDKLHASLAQDYRLLNCLMSHAAGFQLGGYDIEHRMLMVDFALMRGWYSITRKISASRAQSALREMSEIVGHFANTMGERGAAPMGA